MINHEQQVEEQRYLARSQISGALPELSAETKLDYTSVPRLSPNGASLAWTIGLQATWQIYDGGLRYAERRIAAAKTDALNSESSALNQGVSTRTKRSP